MLSLTDPEGWGGGGVLYFELFVFFISGRLIYPPCIHLYKGFSFLHFAEAQRGNVAVT